MNKLLRYAPEVRERAVRMVLDREREGGSQWESIGSIAGKIGCSRETLRRWVREGERDAGQRPGPTGDERERIRMLEREVRELRPEPMRSCARPALILPRRSSTARSSDDRLH